MIFGRRRLVAAALVVAGFLSFASAQAFATGALRLSSATGLVQGQMVFVAGSGLAANAFGYVLECNGTPGEPTVFVGAPFDEPIPVGCSPPSLKQIVSTTPTGSMSAAVKVHVSRKLGPPCSFNSVFGPCGHADSAHQRPRGDAQNYPCPPSPAQQAAGVTCSLVFYDTAHEKVAAPIKFVGGEPPVKVTPTTAPGGTTPTTAPHTTPTTAPHTTPTTVPPTTAPPTTAPHTVVVVHPATADPGATAPATATATATSPAVVHASSGSLAFTGLGSTGKKVALLGAVLLLLGLVLFFVNLRKLAHWLLGL
jgi:hypothetical protein